MRRVLLAAIAAAALLPVLAPAVAAAQAAAPLTTTAQAPGANAEFLTLDALRKLHGRKGDRYADIGGLSIRYRDEGKGRVVVLMHGSHSSLDSYDGVAAVLLKRHYRVIRFDMPGMGLSSMIPSTQATDTPFGDDILKALLTKQGVTKAVFVGVSSGGSMGFNYAARFPDEVEALVLSNTPADPVYNERTVRSPDLFFEFEEARKTGFRRYSYWDTYLKWLAGRTARMTPQIVSHYYDMNRREPFKDGHYFWRSTQEAAETQAAIAAVKAPTLIIWGVHDLVLPIAKEQALEGYLKSASVSAVLLTDVGHYPPLEVPDRFAAILDTYITKVLPND